MARSRSASSGPPEPHEAGQADRRADAAERRRRRAALLAEIAEARELRARVAPRRARLQKTREVLLHRMFRFDPPPRRSPDR
jgi:hypothetical protein